MWACCLRNRLIVWRRQSIQTPSPRTRSGVQRDQVLDRERLIPHGADAPWLDAGSSSGLFRGPA
ncbi:hypothetical protein DC439_10235 [Agrobacterium tumefaciens]|nr:hypothetical protein DC439_10235 [Agrobacterium tumefaciens]